MNHFTNIWQEDSPLVLDSAMGTELDRRGVCIDLPLWSARAIREAPQVILKIHEDNILAGADVITANTFRTDARSFRKAGLTSADARQATLKAVDLARQAIRSACVQHTVSIAGSMSPLEDCYHPERYPDDETALQEHRQKARWLAEAGVDLILIETMNSLREAGAATTAALETGLPVITSFILNRAGKIFNGDDPFDTFRTVQSSGIIGLGMNCTHHSIVSTLLESYFQQFDLPLIVYVNSGIFHPDTGWEDDPGFSAETYEDIAADWYRRGVRMVGGCCGTTPEHIRAVRRAKAKARCEGESHRTRG